MDDRPIDDRRAEYAPGCPREEFLIPILAREINAALDAQRPAPGGNTKKALDVGCGRGPFRSRILSLGFEYYGNDVIQNRDNTVNFISAVDEDLSDSILATAPFDLLVCTEVLEHVADWDKAFLNFSRLTVPGSRVIITCPHFYVLHEQPYDFWRPTPFAIKYFSERHHFKVLKADTVGDAWDLIGTVLASVDPYAPDRSFSSRLCVKIVRHAKSWLHSILKGKYLRSKVLLYGDVYLTNVAVIERVA